MHNPGTPIFLGAGHARDRNGTINRTAAPIRNPGGRGHGPLLPVIVAAALATRVSLRGRAAAVATCRFGPASVAWMRGVDMICRGQPSSFNS